MSLIKGFAGDSQGDLSASLRAVTSTIEQLARDGASDNSAVPAEPISQGDVGRASNRSLIARLLRAGHMLTGFSGRNGEMMPGALFGRDDNPFSEAIDAAAAISSHLDDFSLWGLSGTDARGERLWERVHDCAAEMMAAVDDALNGVRVRCPDDAELRAQARALRERATRADIRMRREEPASRLLARAISDAVDICAEARTRGHPEFSTALFAALENPDDPEQLSRAAQLLHHDLGAALIHAERVSCAPLRTLCRTGTGVGETIQLIASRRLRDINAKRRVSASLNEVRNLIRLAAPADNPPAPALARNAGNAAQP